MRGYIDKLCLNSLKGEDYTLNFKLSGFWGDRGHLPVDQVISKSSPCSSLVAKVIFIRKKIEIKARAKTVFLRFCLFFFNTYTCI